MTGNRIIYFILILFGLIGLINKYKIVIGGTKCYGKVVWREMPTRYNYRCKLIIEFTYMERTLREMSINRTMFHEVYLGKTVEVYYNEKYPNHVVKKGFWIDISCGFYIILGFLAMRFM